ncbi:MAG: phosphatase PAP2 family protein [Spirochaetia bacterium]|jgi:undecaprenyl-diphosphatase|nr:phosphatase PAP2 family protein [Spirochaetia bacterium]
MQQAILMFFQHIGNPALDIFFQVITLFGEQGILILVGITVLYAMDKDEGFALVTTILAAILSMGCIKAIVKAPRPFQVLDSIKGKRLATATGYSFPSGHTTGASVTYNSLARYIKTQKAWVVASIMVVLVAISRLYLGVHWPVDVAVGYLIGIACTFLLPDRLLDLCRNKKKKIKFSSIVGSILTAGALALGFLLQAKLIEAVAFTDLFKIMAFGGTGYLGFALETAYLDIDLRGTKTTKAIRIASCITAVIVFLAGIKLLLPAALYIPGAFLRYSLSGIWVTFLFPLLSRKILFRSKKTLLQPNHRNRP